MSGRFKSQHPLGSAVYSCDENLLKNVEREHEWKTKVDIHEEKIHSLSEKCTARGYMYIVGLTVSVIVHVILVGYLFVSLHSGSESAQENLLSANVCSKRGNVLIFARNASCNSEHVVAKNGTYVNLCFISAPLAYVYLVNLLLSSSKNSQSTIPTLNTRQIETSRKYRQIEPNTDRKEGLLSTVSDNAGVRTENVTIKQDGWHVVYSHVTLKTMGGVPPSTLTRSILLSDDGHRNLTTTKLLSESVSQSSKQRWPGMDPGFGQVGPKWDPPLTNFLFRCAAQNEKLLKAVLRNCLVTEDPEMRSFLPSYGYICSFPCNRADYPRSLSQ